MDRCVRCCSRSSNCGTHTGKKELDVRVHHCDECGYIKDRDVAAAIVVEQRGAECSAAFLPEFDSGSFFGSLTAVGQTVVLPVEVSRLGTPMKQETFKSDLGKPTLFA